MMICYSSAVQSDGNKEVLCIPQSSRFTGLFSIISRTLIEGDLPLCRDAVNVFYGPSQRGPLKVGMRQTKRG